MVKRLFDVIVALVGLILVLPLLLIVACCVLLSGPGPIVYRGMRIGRYGKPFYMLKFRTMRPARDGDAEITEHHDPRVTRIGHLLRITKIDELLQLLNVLRGEMSLVGPRPHSYGFIRYFTGPASEILTIRPGITGLVQLQFRREEVLFDGKKPEGFYVNMVLPFKQQIDLKYVHYHPFWRDLQILFMTAVVLIRPLPPPKIPMPDHMVVEDDAQILAPVLAGEKVRTSSAVMENSSGTVLG